MGSPGQFARGKKQKKYRPAGHLHCEVLFFPGEMYCKFGFSLFPHFIPAPNKLKHLR